MTIDLLRNICLSLPAATEDLKWENDLVFSVGGKMFCVASLDTPLRYSFKVPDEAFEVWTGQPGIIPAPYLARAKWICIEGADVLGRSEAEQLIRESYSLVAGKLTKKQKAQLGIAL